MNNCGLFCNILQYFAEKWVDFWVDFWEILWVDYTIIHIFVRQ